MKYTENQFYVGASFAQVLLKIESSTKRIIYTSSDAAVTYVSIVYIQPFQFILFRWQKRR